MEITPFRCIYTMGRMITEDSEERYPVCIQLSAVAS